MKKINSYRDSIRISRLCRIPLLLVAWLTILTCGLPVEAEGQTLRFDIPAGSAEETLRSFAKQSGREVIFSTEIAQGVRTNQVRGTLEPKQALAAMLAGTTLAAASDDKDGVIRIIRNETVSAEKPQGSPESKPREGSASGSDGVVQLDPFSVSGSPVKGYRASNSISGTAMNTPLRDVPMNIGVVTSEFLNDALAGNLTRALDFTSSVTQAGRQPINNRVGLFTLRGFRVKNILVDGIPGSDYLPPYFVERIEVVKGPNTIYGQSDPGGIINVISKRPMSYDFANVNIKAGSFGLLEAIADVNANAMDGKLQLRLIGAYRESNGWRWADGTEATFAGLAGTYHVGKKTDINFNVSDNDIAGVSSGTATYSFEIRPTDLNGDGVINSANVNGVVESSARYNNSFLPREYTGATPADRFRQTTRILQAGVRHQFSPHTYLQYSFVNSKQRFSGTFREFNTFSAAGLAPAAYTLNERLNETDVHTLNALFDFETGPLKHRLMAGVRFSDDLSGQPDNSYLLRGNNAGETAILQSMISKGRNIRLQLTKAEILAGVPIWKEDLPTKEEIRSLGTRSSQLEETHEKNSTLFLTDSITLLDGKARALAGIRYAKIKSYSFDLTGARFGLESNQSKATYQVGGVYDLTKSVSIFSNYATSFTPNIVNGTTGTFYPAEKADAMEVGFKLEGLANGIIDGSVSLFEINKRNVVRSDFNPVTFRFDAEITDDRSRGVELDLFFNFKYLNSVLSYTHLDAVTVKSQSTAGGLALEGAAPNRLSIWNSLVLDRLVKGLRLGGGVVWADGPIQQFGTSNSRLVLEDGYTEVSLFARYETKFLQRKVELGLNVSNLTDVFYLRARASVADPRQVIFSVKMDL